MKALQVMFLVWWLFSGGAMYIAFLCARGFWKDYRTKKRAGVPHRFAFWTSLLFATMALEAAITVVASPFTTADSPPPAGLAVALARRTVLTVGVWLWWWKVAK